MILSANEFDRYKLTSVSQRRTLEYSSSGTDLMRLRLVLYEVPIVIPMLIAVVFQQEARQTELRIKDFLLKSYNLQNLHPYRFIGPFSHSFSKSVRK